MRKKVDGRLPEQHPHSHSSANLRFVKFSEKMIRSFLLYLHVLDFLNEKYYELTKYPSPCGKQKER